MPTTLRDASPDGTFLPHVYLLRPYVSYHGAGEPKQQSAQSWLFSNSLLERIAMYRNGLQSVYRNRSITMYASSV